MGIRKNSKSPVHGDSREKKSLVRSFLPVKTIFDLLRKIVRNLSLWAKPNFLLQFFLKVKNGLDRENPLSYFFSVRMVSKRVALFFQAEEKYSF